MSESASTPNGVWCWHDMMTKDPDASVAFYTALFGWEVRDVPMGPMTYKMIHAAGRGIGGFVPLEGAPDEVPSHWIGYVTTEDVDAHCERANANGGNTCVPPMDIPGVGRFAVVTDPGGAVYSPFKGASDEWQPPENPMAEGLICWNELMTNDIAGAKRFYGETVGWTWHEKDMGEMGTYYMPVSDGQERGGMMANPAGVEAPSHWLPYMAVDDVDAAFAKAQGLGATVFVPPQDIPGVGRFAVLADPVGAACFALYASTAAC